MYGVCVCILHRLSCVPDHRLVTAHENGYAKLNFPWNIVRISMLLLQYSWRQPKEVGYFFASREQKTNLETRHDEKYVAGNIFWGLGNIWNDWEYLRPSVLCHNKLTKHHLLLSVSWIRCVSLACKLSMAGSTRYLCGFHKSQLRAAIGCYYSVGKSWRACYLVTTGFERKWVFEAVVIKSEA